MLNLKTVFAIMPVHMTTLKNLQIVIMEPRETVTGRVKTDEWKLRAKDVIQQGNRLLIVDLSKITYIDHATLGTLLNIYNLYADKNGRVILCGINNSVKNIFIIPKLLNAFDIVENKKNALQLLRKLHSKKSNKT